MDAPEHPLPSPAAPPLVVALGVLTLAGVVGLIAVGRMWRAPPALVAAAVFFLPHLHALLAAAFFAAWWRWSSSRALLALWVAVLALGAALWGGSWSASAQPVEGAPLRVLTWNVHRLWGGPGEAADPGSCVAAVVREEAPDVAVFLEVSADDVARLRGELDLRCVHSDYLGTGRPRVGGLAVCARGPRASLLGGGGVPYSDGAAWRYVAAEVGVGDRVMNVVAVHLSPYGVGARRFRAELLEAARGEAGALAHLGASGQQTFKVQGAQAAGLLGRVERFRDPTLLAGDFNSTRDTALHTALRRHLTDAWDPGGRGFGATATLFGWVPLRVDYLYASREFAVQEATVLRSGCSDHLPVVVQLSLAAP
ncbi:MAG: endonuclease/exonuclease/phosphatase family protein [Deltaproteobacteria bacterium]|nr:endonuclease/exonuclease/phosphatase family protein [Deltaproteobacteria bacterium]